MSILPRHTPLKGFYFKGHFIRNCEYCGCKAEVSEEEDFCFINCSCSVCEYHKAIFSISLEGVVGFWNEICERRVRTRVENRKSFKFRRKS